MAAARSTKHGARWPSVTLVMIFVLVSAYAVWENSDRPDLGTQTKPSVVVHTPLGAKAQGAHRQRDPQAVPHISFAVLTASSFARRRLWPMLDTWLTRSDDSPGRYSVHALLDDTPLGHELAGSLTNLFGPRFGLHPNSTAEVVPVPAAWNDWKAGWKGIPALVALLERAPPGTPWHCIVDDDTYVLVDNLERAMAEQPTDKPIVMGSVMPMVPGVFKQPKLSMHVDWSTLPEKPKFVHGGGGICFNRAAADRVRPHIKTCAEAYTEGGGGDLLISLCFLNEGRIREFVTAAAMYWRSPVAGLGMEELGKLPFPLSFHYMRSETLIRTFHAAVVTATPSGGGVVSWAALKAAFPYRANITKMLRRRGPKPTATELLEYVWVYKAPTGVPDPAGPLAPPELVKYVESEPQFTYCFLTCRKLTSEQTSMARQCGSVYWLADARSDRARCRRSRSRLDAGDLAGAAFAVVPRQKWTREVAALRIGVVVVCTARGPCDGRRSAFHRIVDTAAMPRLFCPGAMVGPADGASEPAVSNTTLQLCMLAFVKANPWLDWYGVIYEDTLVLLDNLKLTLAPNEDPIQHSAANFADSSSMEAVLVRPYGVTTKAEHALGVGTFASRTAVDLSLPLLGKCNGPLWSCHATKAQVPKSSRMRRFVALDEVTSGEIRVAGPPATRNEIVRDRGEVVGQVPAMVLRAGAKKRATTVECWRRSLLHKRSSGVGGTEAALVAWPAFDTIVRDCR